MKNSILSTAALVVVLVGAPIPLVDAGVSVPLVKNSTECAGCQTFDCTCDRAVLVALMGIIIFRMPPVVLWEITFIAREV